MDGLQACFIHPHAGQGLTQGSLSLLTASQRRVGRVVHRCPALSTLIQGASTPRDVLLLTHIKEGIESSFYILVCFLNLCRK